MLANGKVARQLASKAGNPEYRFTEGVEHFSLGELAAPILMFGDIPAATLRRDLVVYFFQNERLPSDLGWTKQDSPVVIDQILSISGTIKNATSLFTVDAALDARK